MAISFDRNRFTVIAHGTLPFWNPIAPEVLEDWISKFGLSPTARILDVGCGRGEFLLRTVARHRCRGVGVDSHPLAVEFARKESARRKVGDLMMFHCEIFTEDRFSKEPLDLAACIGSTHAIGTYKKTLRILCALVRPEGTVLVGEGYWKKDPDPGYLKFLGAEVSDLQTHQGNLSLGKEMGLEVVSSHEASPDEWGHYEDTYAANVNRFVSDNPKDPQAPAMKQRIDAWREAYLKWGRDTLGFGLYLFRTPAGVEGSR